MIILVKVLKKDRDQFRDKKRPEKHGYRKIVINFRSFKSVHVLTDKNSKKNNGNQAIKA